MKINIPNNDIIIAAVNLLKGRNDIVKDNSIESKYSGYIASFGGSIIQCDLVGTLLIFEANTEKKIIIDMLFELHNSYFGVIKKTNNFYYDTIKDKTIVEIRKIKVDLCEVAVALKLAMRCYKKVDNQKED